MCLAIYKPADTAPDWGAYENGYDSNPDGWGFAVVDNGELLTACGMGTFQEFRSNFEPFSHCQAIIHFRWATHGVKDESNCHPFFAGDLAVIHNGVIDIDTKSDESRSDTSHFVERVIAPMYERDPDFFLREDVVFNMELAHAGSKFVFLRQDGVHGVWNRKAGLTQADGHWYSNDGFMPSRYGYYSSKKVVAKVGATAFSDDYSRAIDDEEEYQRWKYENGYVTEEDTYDRAYYEKMENDLMSFGFSRDTIDEVFGMLGWGGIEALHDEL